MLLRSCYDPLDLWGQAVGWPINGRSASQVRDMRPCRSGRERRLRWFGHVMRSNGEINMVRSRPVPGRKGPGRPKKTWDECVKQDLKVCGLSEAGTQDRVSWRSSVKNSRQEPTPSNGSAPQSMAAPPARRVLGMRTRSFNKTGFDWFDWLIEQQDVDYEALVWVLINN